MTLQAGIHRIPMADYLADPCERPSLSSGAAFRLLNESPLHAWHQHPRLGGRVSPPSDAADVGSIAHDLLLGGEGKICEIDRNDYPSAPVKKGEPGKVPTGWTNGAIRLARDTARANGLIPILKEDVIGIRAMVKAAREFVADSEIAGVFDAGESELTVISNDSSGAILRTRPDWLNLDAGISLSFKTSKASVHPNHFPRLMQSMGYGFADRFYARALKAHTRMHIRQIILAQQQQFPYACALYELSPEKADLEAAEVERAINLWQQCIESDSWPGYGGRIHIVEPKPWETIGEIQVEDV